MHDIVCQEMQKKTIVELSAKRGGSLLQGRVLSSLWRVGERELGNWRRKGFTDCTAEGGLCI